MANKDSNKNLTDLIAAIGAVATLITAATPLLKTTIDNFRDKSAENMSNKIRVPDLYKKGFPIDLEQAEKLLADCGLKMIKSELKIKDANPKYRNCFDGQVLNSSPKQGAFVNVGATICLQYITEAVIAESEKLFEDANQTKEENKERRRVEKSIRSEHRKELLATVAEKAHSNTKKIFKRDNSSNSIKEGEP